MSLITPELKAKFEKVVARYPKGQEQSAVIPLLHLFQESHGGSLTAEHQKAVADYLSVPISKVHEVTTFYTMYKLAPAGKHHVQICTSLSCWLRGSDEVVRACKERLGISFGSTTPDGVFSMEEVECAGACVNAPVIAVDDDYFEDVDGAAMWRVIDAYKRGELPGSVEHSAYILMVPMSLLRLAKIYGLRHVGRLAKAGRLPAPAQLESSLQKNEPSE